MKRRRSLIIIISIIMLLSIVSIEAVHCCTPQGYYMQWHYDGDIFYFNNTEYTVSHYWTWDQPEVPIYLTVGTKGLLINEGQCKEYKEFEYCVTEINKDLNTDEKGHIKFEKGQWKQGILLKVIKHG